MLKENGEREFTFSAGPVREGKNVLNFTVLDGKEEIGAALTAFDKRLNLNDSSILEEAKA